MKIVGIVAEYNPFHGGHEYHIRQAKEQTGADAVLVVMSGDFVQRGEPAIYNKYLRTRMALSCGADFVFELPSLFAVSSAEDFSACAVHLLDCLGADFICFGSEDGRVEPIKTVARILAEEPEEFSFLLKEELKRGRTWPQARNHALVSLAEKDSSFPMKKEEVSQLLSSPNNLLGIEYCKALYRYHSAVVPVTIQRKGQGYHDEALDKEQASASAIRALFSGYGASFPPASVSPDFEVKTDRSDLSSGLWEQLLTHIPEHLLPLYQEGRPLTAKDFSALLNYTLLTCLETGQELTQFADISLELAARLSRMELQYADWEGRVRQLKTKQYTYTRISRALLHLLLGIRTEDILSAKEGGYVFYGRLLGFRKDCVPLLSELKKRAALPLLTKMADAPRILTPDAFAVLKKDLYASHVRQSVEASKYGICVKNEYNQPICIL